MAPFDFFIALDGHGLNGFEGYAGVARLRGDPDADRWDVEVRFFDGVAGGHATQLSPGGTVGFLGNLSQQLLFYDPRTLAEVARCSTLRWAAPRLFYDSQTHVVWLDDRRFVTVIGAELWRFSLDDLDHPEPLGAHGVTLPHAIKRSPSGRYLFYGAMDVAGTYANQLGVFDLEAGTARVVRLPATVWHLGVHPTEDVCYAPTQRCTPQDGDFTEYVIAHFKNYLFEIDGATASVRRHLAIPKDLPGALTSDVIVTEDEVVYNCCASGVLARVALADLRTVRYRDERPGPWRQLRELRAGAGNLVEAVSRANLLGAPHWLVKAVRVSRGSLLDGSYGLGLAPDRRFLLSAHRGLNEVIVYRYPDLAVHRRIPFPPMRRYARHLGWIDDTRLGFHHAQLCVASAAAAPGGAA
ncbi:MAG: hypothetical protein H6708_34110 [Kofleriaceae bacterium]|nr:hypothetical protein [Myxococcales bacterium]MCB9565450.1 hypothetical protein [Kofleriaceae bacterium]